MNSFILTKDNISECYDPATGQLIQTSGKVILPETVLYRGEIYRLIVIGHRAFAGCTNLTEIDIPNSVTKIGRSAFLDCRNLNSVHLPEGITAIGYRTFQCCTNLTDINIPDSVTEIGYDTFSDCRNLTTVHIPEGITAIGYRAFANCTNLTEINIPDSVTEIRNVAFQSCTSLTEIDIPDSVMKIEEFVFMDCSPELLISYHGSKFPLKTLELLQKQSDGLSMQTCFDIMAKHIDITGPDVYSPVLAKKLCDARHDDRLDVVADKIQQDFQTIGFYSISSEVDLQAKEQLTEMFQNNKATRGVVPKIIDALTIASTELGIHPEEIVSAFEEKKFRDAVISMRSCHRGNRFCDVEAALFAMNFDVNTIKNVILKNPYKDYASMLLCESYVKKDGHLKDVAAWIADHPDVSSSLIHDIVKYRDQVCITKDMNVTAVQEQLSINQARMEIANIEHQYQGFHLSECICSLPKTEVTLGRYKAYIMEGDDPRQVMLGYDTDCCQHYDGAGESAMMYGLINPDAGFFVIEDTKTGRILAQAETWQDTDGRRLVFDNIEFADDRQVSQFAPVLSRWCAASPYPDILMGNGYNELTDDRIRTTEGIEPPMKDAYYTILEQEEDYNYDEPDPYTDADNSCSVLKADGKVEPYFMEEESSYLQSLPTVTLTKENIGTFIDPASGGPVRLSGDVTIPDIMMDSNDTLHVVTGLNGTFTDNKDITSVFIPDTVTSCTEDTFAGCDQLQEVEMTNDLQAAMEHEAEATLPSTEDLDPDDEFEDR